MSERIGETPKPAIEFDYDLGDAPHKVWRAIVIPELRERWLPGALPADAEAASLTPGREIAYRMRESEPPFIQSTVTFRIGPNATGGTRLRIIHEVTDARFERVTKAAANGNRRTGMLAA